ncbi:MULTISPECIES: dTDP-4-dehydrorhamnose reductase [Lactococcus]|uniref:dTDP-4-dehydrorhamnose reductase n=1 Tax=Lactococcus TaxID=1357 RepID=UPI00129EAB59|nr:MULTISPECIES: dTDP-4-dehydrorhamnose reductase [Lactococcus]NHI78453.1 dTDP-4-dehydrorhamnose reductase [Lactococcus petauri]QSR02247.1 dTDP-4-dehydrorhamnose reductase [Lactococcus sp. LG1074]
MNLIIGKNGLLGRELCLRFDREKIPYLATGSHELDITDKVAVDAYFSRHKPQIIYLCAGYTAVEKAEQEERHLAEQVNAVGTENIAQAAENVGALLLYVSTDYVFSGNLELGKEWEVDDVPHPQTHYGYTQLLGENAVQKNTTKHYIIRTSWLFGCYGNNFVSTMKNKAKNKDDQVIMVVNDQFGCPTWTRTLADFMIYLVQHKPKYGIYHLSNAKVEVENISWFKFAKYILRQEEVKLLPLATVELASNVKRSYNSTLSIKKTEAIGFSVPTWQEALNTMQRLENGE